MGILGFPTRGLNLKVLGSEGARASPTSALLLPSLQKNAAHFPPLNAASPVHVGDGHP